MAWWIWALAALVLMGAEVLLPADFFLLLIGGAAAITGALVALGLLPAGGTEWVTFAVVAILLLVVLRPILRRRLTPGGPSGDVDSLVGTVGTATSSLAARQVGTVELRGTTWSALNVGALPLAAGERCVVERVSGLTVHVSSEHKGGG